MTTRSNKLTYRNNWGADEYFINGKRVKSLKKVRIGTKEYKVETREISIPYNDMGHTYHGTSDHYFVEETVFGIKKKFDLNELVSRKAIFALVYTTE
jgi:hypothetical protein